MWPTALVETAVFRDESFQRATLQTRGWSGVVAPPFSSSIITVRSFSNCFSSIAGAA
jgi:hypothetical protein